MLRRPTELSIVVAGAVEKCPYAEYVLSKKDFHFINKGVYVLELLGDKYYVGKSNNITQRLEQHKQGSGNVFVNTVGFLRRIPPATPYLPDFEAWERAETLHWMRAKGITEVRGWMYTTLDLNKNKQKHAWGQICERYDLCRRCGKPGHYLAECQESKRKRVRFV